MKLCVREMELEETEIIVNYFRQATAEHLELLGVDPTRLPDPVRWREFYAHEFRQPIEQRKTFLVLWKLDGAAAGFSTADKIIYGQEAYMHLHIINPEQRKAGIGTAFRFRHFRGTKSREPSILPERITHRSTKNSTEESWILCCRTFATDSDS